MNATNEWGANYYVLVGTKQLNSINAFTTAPYSNGGNVVFWIALNSQKQWGRTAVNATVSAQNITLPIPFSNTNYFVCSDYFLDATIEYVYGQNHGYPVSNSVFHAWNARNNTASQWFAAGY